MQVKANTTYRHFIPWGISLILFILCGLLAYQVLDQAVTLDHQEQQYTRFQEQLDTLQTVAVPFMKGITKVQFITLLQKNKIEHFVNEYNDVHTII